MRSKLKSRGLQKVKVFANLTDLQHLKNRSILSLFFTKWRLLSGAEYTIRFPQRTGNLKIGERCVLFVDRWLLAFESQSNGAARLPGRHGGGICEAAGYI